MTEEKKPLRGRPFQKGQSGNPKGRPRLPDELREVKHITADEVRKILSRFLRMKRDELQALVQNPDTPAVELYIASMLHKGVNFGDPGRLEFLFNRVIGKVKNELEHTFPRPTVIVRVAPGHEGEQVILGAEKGEDDDKGHGG